MNRSSRGFGLTGVAVAVVAMIVMAVFSTSAQSATDNALSATNNQQQIQRTQ